MGGEEEEEGDHVDEVDVRVGEVGGGGDDVGGGAAVELRPAYAEAPGGQLRPHLNSPLPSIPSSWTKGSRELDGTRHHHYWPHVTVPLRCDTPLSPTITPVSEIRVRSLLAHALLTPPPPPPAVTHAQYLVNFQGGNVDVKR